MKTGTIIAIVAGVVGLATGGYILYRRKQSNDVLVQAQQEGTVAIPQQGISPYEGKAYKMDGKTYLVRNGVLRHLANPAVRARELGSNDWDLIVKSGVGANVTTLPPLPIGPQLTGFKQNLLR